METFEMPHIGHRDDAIEVLEQLIEIAKTSAEANKALVLGLEAIKDVIVREAI